MNEYEIIWSPSANESYFDIISSILKEWSVEEARAFDNKVEGFIQNLKYNKHLCPESKIKSVRRCVVSKQTSMTYRIVDNTIEIVSFIDNRSDHDF